LDHLSKLQRLFSRPRGSIDFGRYNDALHSRDIPICELTNLPSDNMVKKLINALYGRGDSSIHVAAPDDLDIPLFAVWSQQWPRLRRNFRFQTAAVRSTSSIGSARFDITASIESPLESLGALSDRYPEWVTAACKDLVEFSRGELRKFLWHYGLDVRRQKSSFKPLVELWLDSTRMSSVDGEKIGELLKRNFPNLEDALDLKLDLLNGVLMPAAQPALIRRWVQQNKIPSLPDPSIEGVRRIKELWASCSQQLLELAELSASKNGPIESEILKSVTDNISSAEFWELTRHFADLQGRMLDERPELLFETGALELEDENLASKLSLFDERDSRLDDFIQSLIHRGSEKLIVPIFNYFPLRAAKQVIKAENKNSAACAKAWRAELVRRPELLLTSEVLGAVSHKSTLYDFLQLLGLSSQAVLSVGSEPWVVALSRATIDLNGERDDIFNSSLLVLSLVSSATGQKGVELLFESVHEKLMDNCLHGKACEILDSWLPKSGWFSNWDLGLRLRLMVLNAYIKNHWPIESFIALSHDPQTRVMLSETASDVPGGKNFARALKG
ncbi:hypothetical protein ABFV55_18335, partial [Pseudomonas syringae]